MIEREITKEESLSIITGMINQAKHNVARGGSFYFLMWGLVATAANLGHWAIQKFSAYPHPYVVWVITIPAIIATIAYSMRHASKSRTTGYFDHLYGHIWIAVFVGIIVTLGFMVKIGFNSTPIILILIGIGTYLNGQILRFRPLIVGSIVLWLTAVIAFTMPVVEQYLVASIGIVGGYLIPGIMLKKAESE